MRAKPIRFLFVLVLVLLLSACSWPSASTPSPAAASTPDPCLLGSDCSRPSAPAPSPATALTTDPCLLGVWTMDAYALNNKLLDLTGAPNLLVMAPSAMRLEFRTDNTFVMGGQVTIRAEMNAGNYMEVDGTHQYSGHYTLSGSTLKTSDVASNVEYGEARAYINGEQTTGSMPAPAFSTFPPPEAQYVCSANSLQITFIGPFGPVTEEWQR